MSSDEEIDTTVHTTDSGASGVMPTQVGSLKKGGYCMLRDRPVKIVDYSTAKVGKHGAAKAHIVGIDIFTGKKIEEIHPTGHNINVPDVKRNEYELVDITKDGYLNMLNDKSEEKNDVKVPDDEIGQKLRQSFEEGKTVLVQCLSALGEECVAAFREAAS